MDIKINETYHVASCCCPLYAHEVSGKIVSFIFPTEYSDKVGGWQQRWDTDQPQTSTIYFVKIESSWQLVQLKNGTELKVRGDKYNKSQWREGCSRMVSGTPFPPWGLIILVTKYPKLSWTSRDPNGFRLSF